HEPETTEHYPRSLHDALPIFGAKPVTAVGAAQAGKTHGRGRHQLPRDSIQLQLVKARGESPAVHLHRLADVLPLQGALAGALERSEEHTSELQSRENLVCRLL